MHLAARRLPGIGFDTQAPALSQSLPRMDIAGFVGFASFGPLDAPVAIDDPAQFADVFGPDAPLAWDPQRGVAATSFLGPAVRAFFANGGRRCWIVRVADAGEAETDAIALSGLVAIDRGGRVRPATLLARAPGSAADGLRARTWVEPTSVRVMPVDLHPTGSGFTAAVEAPARLDTGDMLRIAPPGSEWAALMTVGAAREPLDPRVEGRCFTPGLTRWARGAAPAAGASGHVHWIGPNGADRTVSATVVGGASERRTRLALDVAVSAAPAVGAMARGVFGGRTFWLGVSAIEADGERTAIDGTTVEVRATRPAGAAIASEGAFGQRLTLAVLVEAPGGETKTLGGLGLDAAHPRFAAGLPSDALLYDGNADPPAAYPALLAAAAQPRFPLAGGAERAPVGPETRRPVTLLPLGASMLPSPALGAIRPAGTARHRDGLDDFDASLFADGDLAGTSVRTLAEQADWIRYAAPSPRRLRGVHALMAIDEVTLVAVPDAVQPGWTSAPAPHVPDPAPATPAPAPPPSTFAACASRVPATPVLSLQGNPATGVFTLAWTATDVDAARYELQEARDPEFAQAEPRYDGPNRSVTLYGRPDAPRVFRVRAVAGERASGWSATVVVAAPGARRWHLRAPEEHDAAALASVQTAMLTMCAARGDMLAVLALPAHFREADAIAHAGALRGTRADDPVPSFGALYHPWLYATDPARPGPPIALPPDGAATGTIAERALRSGVWTAPANIALRSAVALAPALATDRHAALQAAQVNVVRRAPAGILVLAADTLAGSEALRPIGVRRLLSLLRRVALEHGEIATFEPNDDVLARTLRRTFEGLLSHLHVRGAFAGTTAAESYQVWTGAPPNSSATRDAGQVIVELRVAPSRPLAFITVRIVRTGDGTVAVEVT